MGWEGLGRAVEATGKEFWELRRQKNLYTVALRPTRSSFAVAVLEDFVRAVPVYTCEQLPQALFVIGVSVNALHYVPNDGGSRG